MKDALLIIYYSTLFLYELAFALHLLQRNSTEATSWSWFSANMARKWAGTKSMS